MLEHNTYLGEPELIDFTRKDGVIVKRLMVPIRSKITGGWLAWITPEQAEEMEPNYWRIARGVKYA